MTDLDLNPAAFKGWLVANRAEILDPTNPYEVVRYRARGRVEVIHRNKVGFLSIGDGAVSHVTAYLDNRDLDLSNPAPAGRVVGKVLNPPSPLELLRDHFAGQALQGMIVAGGQRDTDDHVAQRAYAMADAMLRAREAK